MESFYYVSKNKLYKSNLKLKKYDPFADERIKINHDRQNYAEPVGWYKGTTPLLCIYLPIHSPELGTRDNCRDNVTLFLDQHYCLLLQYGFIRCGYFI